LRPSSQDQPKADGPNAALRRGEAAPSASDSSRCGRTRPCMGAARIRRQRHHGHRPLAAVTISNSAGGAAVADAGMARGRLLAPAGCLHPGAMGFTGGGR
jgi:hypothetical protein